jgi:hypothetical protein
VALSGRGTGLRGRPDQRAFIISATLRTAKRASHAGGTGGEPHGRTFQPYIRLSSAFGLSPYSKFGSAHATSRRIRADECPLLGEERTSAVANPMSAFDPKRTSLSANLTTSNLPV